MFNGLERQKQRLPSLNFDIRLSISACDGTGAPGKKENDLVFDILHSSTTHTSFQPVNNFPEALQIHSIYSRLCIITLWTPRLIYAISINTVRSKGMFEDHFTC